MKIPLLRPLQPAAQSQTESVAQDFQRQFYESGYEAPLVVPTRPRILDAWLPSVSRLDVAVSLLPGGVRLLDVGCGDGQLLEQAAVKFKELFGVDIARNRVERANERLKHLLQPCDLRTVKLDRESLPFESDFFDAVVAVAVLPFVFDVDHALHEMTRVLKPGGALLVQTNNLGFLRHRLSVLFRGEVRTSYFYGWDGNTLHYFSRTPLVDALGSCGLRVQTISTSGRLQKIRAKWPAVLGADLIVLAKKAQRPCDSQTEL